jgi:hypothetical protein
MPGRIQRPLNVMTRVRSIMTFRSGMAGRNNRNRQHHRYFASRKRQRTRVWQFAVLPSAKHIAEQIPSWESWKTLAPVTAYLPSMESGSANTTTIRRPLV